MKSCGVTIQTKPLLQKLGIVLQFKAHFRDTRLIRTPHYYGQFSLSLGKKPDINFPLHSIHLTVRHHINTDIFYGQFSVYIKGV